MTDPPSVQKLPHHEQLEFCYTRARYRQGRKLTSVKAYTVNDESKYLILCGIPAIKIQEELERLCLRYGNIELLKVLTDYPQDEYAESFLVKYNNIKNARFAKIKLDGRSFYGGVLHVFYAPELETVDETREKLADRRKSIAALTRYNQDASEVNKTKQLNSAQIRNVAVKRYLSQLKKDVARTYQKHFLTSDGSDNKSGDCTNSSEVSLEVPVTIGPSTSNTDIDSFSTEHCLQSQCVDSTDTSGEHLGSDTKISSLQTRQQYFSNKNVSQTPKKIRLFKDAKILSYNENAGDS